VTFSILCLIFNLNLTIKRPTHHKNELYDVLSGKVGGIEFYLIHVLRFLNHTHQILKISLNAYIIDYVPRSFAVIFNEKVVDPQPFNSDFQIQKFLQSGDVEEIPMIVNWLTQDFFS
jgi:hypothetical protein